MFEDNATMYRGLVYRAELTPEQLTLAVRTVGCCRFVVNRGVDHVERALAGQVPLPSYAELSAMLPPLKLEHPWLAEVPAVCLQQAMRDLSRAITNHRQRRANPPRRRKRYLHDRFRVPGQKTLVRPLSRKWAQVRLPRFGWVRFRLTRPLQGRIVSVTVRRDAVHWLLAFCVERTPPRPLANTHPPVGIDRGVKVAVATSSGELLDRACWTEGEARRLLALERRKARQTKGSNRYRLTCRRIAQQHARARSRRDDFLHKTSAHLANNHSLIVLEALPTANMTRSAGGTIEQPGRNVRAKARLNRAILDKGWARLAILLDYKAAEQGGQVTTVPAAFSSQTCAECGHVDRRNRPTRDLFRCVVCGYRAHADVNAAKVVLSRGIVAVAAGQPVAGPAAGWAVDARDASLEAETRTPKASLIPHAGMTQPEESPVRRGGHQWLEN
jgi:putative transposase